ncbi:MAG: VOC family protein [Proteobacteria bacterium]|nr:VOC family protein [Pseudomonadota bacterium]
MLIYGNSITLAVQNVDQSFKFYKEILGLIPLVKWEKGAYFLVGEKSDQEGSAFWFCLNGDEKRMPSPCYTHYAFTVSEIDFENMAQKIKASGAQIFKDNTSPGQSLYFLDPDGHKLEIHTQNWKSRISSKKEDLGNWKDVVWFV